MNFARTKIQPPRPRATFVERGRVQARLAEALVSAEPKYATAANAKASIRDQFKDNNSPTIDDALGVDDGV
jgi:hypothetical protein